MNRHLDKFFHLGCASSLVGVFPNSKEVTESFAVYEAARTSLGTDVLHDASVMAICPGDGVSPRTGATAALRSAWTVKSVDPKMGTKWVRCRHAIKRLSCVRAKAESLTYAAQRIVILATHSHADLPALLAKCNAPRIDIVSLPCCVPDGLGKPGASWEDVDCISPQRLVNVYLDVRGAA